MIPLNKNDGEITYDITYDVTDIDINNNANIVYICG